MKSIEIEEEAWTNNILLSTRVDSRPPMKWHRLRDVTHLGHVRGLPRLQGEGGEEAFETALRATEAKAR